MKTDILMVDDDLDLLELVDRLFRKKGFNIQTASSARAAIEILKNDEPGVLILDVHMPDMTGPQFLDLLDEMRPDLTKKISILFSSAGPSPQDDRVKIFFDKTAGAHKLVATVAELVLQT